MFDREVSIQASLEEPRSPCTSVIDEVMCLSELLVVAPRRLEQTPACRFGYAARSRKKVSFDRNRESQVRVRG